jgi:hypothetical protein
MVEQTQHETARRGSLGLSPMGHAVLRTRKLFPAAFAILLLALQGVSGWCQMHPRGGFSSGPAGVLLIARVESLSVKANAATGAVPGFSATANAAQPIAITTSWAVPANYTTFRVSEYFGGPQEAASGQAAGGPEAAGTGLNPIVVESGETNAAQTRTDLVDAAGDGKQDSDGEGMSILVQAL